MKFTIHFLFGLLSLSLMPFFQTRATTLTYTNYTTWTQNVNGATELDFSSIHLTSPNYSTSTGKTLTAMGNSSLAFVFTGPYSGGYQLTGNDYGSGNAISLFGPTAGKGNITVTLPASGENALLLGLGSTGSATSIAINLSDGESFSVAATANAYEFLGLSLSHNISWLTVSTTTQPVIDDFYFATSKLTQDTNNPPAPPDGQPTSSTPECATLVLFGSGLLSLVGFRKYLTGYLAA